MVLYACPALFVTLGNAWYESTGLRHYCSHRCPSSLQLPHWLDSENSVKWIIFYNSHTQAQPLDRPCPRESRRSETRYCFACLFLFVCSFVFFALFVYFIIICFVFVNCVFVDSLRCYFMLNHIKRQHRESSISVPHREWLISLG